ncbi:hypothetical protein BsWGS_02954 [Bradybaena similaris]
MQASKQAVGTCCRRRTLTNKILPAIIQALIAVALWEVLKSVLPSSATSGDNSSIKTARSPLGLPNCPASDITYSKILTILDLNSLVLLTQASSKSNPSVHSKVDIYIRYKKQDDLIFYPAGSLIDIGEITANISRKLADEVVKKDYAVEIDDHVNEEHGVNDRLGNRNAKQGTIHQFPSGNEPQKVNFASKGKADDNGRFNPEVQQGNLYGGIRNDASFTIAEKQQKPIARDTWNVKMQQSNKQSEASKTVGSKQQSDPFEYLKLLHQNLAKNLALVDSSDPKGLGGSDKRPGGNEQPNYGNQFGYESQENIHNADTKIISRGILIDETGDRLYAEGFLDRVRQLSLEMFGKEMKNISVNEEPIRLVMNSPNVCSVVKDPDVIFLINSAPKNTGQRQRIRDTFVNPSYFRNDKIAHVFVVGKTMTPIYQQSLYREQSDNRDIIQGDFLDAPEHDTSKGLLGMRWVTQYCSLAKYIMKINDVVFVDTEKLLHGLIPAVKMIPDKRKMFCDFTPGSDISRSGPNGISPELFPGRSRIRPYCKGFAVLMSRGVISSLLAASDYVPQIHVDDLYLYGILPVVAGSVDIFHVGSKRAFHNSGLETVGCYKTRLDRCPFVASIAFEHPFTDLWEIVKARMQKPHQNWENERSLWDIESYRWKF